jgi:hypothetical protein
MIMNNTCTLTLGGKERKFEFGTRALYQFSKMHPVSLQNTVSLNFLEMEFHKFLDFIYAGAVVAGGGKVDFTVDDLTLWLEGISVEEWMVIWGAILGEEFKELLTKKDAIQQN